MVEALAEQRSYWGRVLREGSLPELELPLDLPRPTTQTFNGGMVSVSVAAEKMVRLEGMGRSQSCTLYQMVLALWSVLLCRHASQEEVVIGSPYHGRDAAGTELLIG